MFSAARERVRQYVSDGRSTSWTPREISTTVHVLVLLLTLVLAGLSNNAANAFAWSLVIVVAAVVGTVPQWKGNALRLVSVVESVACVIAVLESGGANSPLFPYLLAPAFTARMYSSETALTFSVGGQAGLPGYDIVESTVTVMINLSMRAPLCWLSR